MITTILDRNALYIKNHIFKFKYQSQEGKCHADYQTIQFTQLTKSGLKDTNQSILTDEHPKVYVIENNNIELPL